MLSRFMTRYQQQRLLLALNHVLLLVGVLIFALPFFWMISGSLKDIVAATSFPPQWIPQDIRWDNYARIFRRLPMVRMSMNTIYLSVMTAVGVTFGSSLAAYSFARLKWPGRDILFLLTLATMMLPPQVTMIPMYILFRNLGWIGTFMPLWVVHFFGNGYNIFLLRQFFRGIPDALSEAARIDGCSEFGIYSQIILPMAKPALTVVFIFQFITTWKDYMGPLIYLRDQAMFTLSLGLTSFATSHGGIEVNLLMGAGLITMLPLVIIYFFAQKVFVEGISMTGIKG